MSSAAGKFLSETGGLPPIRSKAAMSPNAAAFVAGTDIDQEAQGAKLLNPYSQSSWVYSAISILAQNVANIPFRISRMGGGNVRKVRSLRNSADPRHRSMVRRALNQDIIDSGDVVDLFQQPHPTMDASLFWEMVVTWFCMRGEFFILPLDTADQPVDLSERNPRVQRMVTLDTGLFWHHVMGYELVAWRYTGSPLLTPIPSEYLSPSEVVYSRAPNPYLYWRGLSPLVVAMLSAQTDYAGGQFQKGLWVNNADTGVIVSTEQVLDESQRKAIETALRERKRKAGTADRPLFLFGGAKVDKPTLSLMDMQFLETRKFLRQEIFSIFKVPESIAGFTADLNDGGAGGSLDAAKIHFVESTLGALTNRIENAVNKIVATFGDDLIGWFDLDSLPIMQAARRARIDTATKMFGIGIPLNDINENLDLRLPDYPWGKKGYLPFNLQEAGAGAEPLPGEDPDPEPEPDNDPDDAGETDDDASEKSNPFLRFGKLLKSISNSPVQIRKPDTKLIWENHVTARRKQVRLFQAKTRSVLNEYRGTTLSKLNEVHLEKAAGRLGEIRSLVDLIFDQHGFGTDLASALKAPMQSTLKMATDELLSEIGSNDPWELPPKKVTEYLNSRTQMVQGTSRTVRDQLNTTLEEGIQNGETTAELAGRVKQVFNKLSDGEARRIAMTETNSAYNFSRHETMQEVGIDYKAWLSSHGPTVRPAHAAAEDYYIDAPIPVDEPFLVGGEELMYPGDPNGSPGNIINCQCVQLAAQKQSEDAKTMTFKIYGVGQMTFPKA